MSQNKVVFHESIYLKFPAKSEEYKAAKPLLKNINNKNGSESIDAAMDNTNISHFNLNIGREHSENLSAATNTNYLSQFTRNGRGENAPSSESIEKAFTSVNSRFADYRRRH
tara:strand:+ start:214 stop:549 length:336 start_codon:yes stop_codon:yes gene_type:complete